MNQTIKKIFLTFMLCATLILSLPTSGYCQVVSLQANLANSPEQALQTPAGKFIQDLGNHAIAIIADKSLSQDQRANKYHAILNNAFDMKTIAHFVIGRAYDSSTPEQQQEYMKLFEQLVVKIYGDRLSFYSGEKFRVTSVRQENDKDIIVSSEVDHSGGTQPTNIDWRVRQDNGKLSIIDVIIAGVSQSVTQRQEYASVVQRDGGKIDSLLDLMRQQVQGTPTSRQGQ